VAAAAEVLAAAAREEAGDLMNWRFFMPRIDHDRVLAAIRAAEAKTSGEIRVLVARHKAPDPIAAAQAYFERMGMAKSPNRNGVLIFLAPLSRRFAVIGDKAVHEKCGDAFWADLAEAMGERFRRKAFTDGLVHGIERAGDLLASTFPRSGGDAPARDSEALEIE
jgi:uncharacterized membrane protein